VLKSFTKQRRSTYRYTYISGNIPERQHTVHNLCSGWLAISLPQYHQLHAGLQTSLGRYGTPFSGLFTCYSSQCKERAAWASRRNLNQLLHTLHAPHSERRERTCTPGSPTGSAVACHACKNNSSYDTSRCNDTYIIYYTRRQHSTD
jgi:hypothetical protein